MKLGSFEIPEKRLVPDALADVKRIYDTIKSDEIPSKELSQMLGYKYPTATPFYQRLNSMLSYGLLEGRGSFRVSQLGKALSYPESEKQTQILKAKSVLNVPLWNEIYKKFKQSPPAENFWVQLRSVTSVEPQEAQKVEKQVRKWYVEDIAQVREDLSLDDVETKTEGLSSMGTNTKTLSQQLVRPEIDSNSLGRLTIKGIGDFDLTDADTITLAESALAILRKKLPSKSIEPPKAEERASNLE